MNIGNAVTTCVPIAMSSVALLISILSFILSYHKFRLEKSNLRAEIKKLRMDELTAAYPSMESDDSKYKIDIQISNVGYRSERLARITSHYHGSHIDIDYKKTIEEKSQEIITLEYRRREIMDLVGLSIIPIQDRPLKIKHKELKKWQIEVSKHIAELGKQWENGKRRGNT
jgi:hypothetical protein